MDNLKEIKEINAGRSIKTRTPYALVGSDFSQQ